MYQEHYAEYIDYLPLLKVLLVSAQRQSSKYLDSHTIPEHPPILYIAATATMENPTQESTSHHRAEPTSAATPNTFPEESALQLSPTHSAASSVDEEESSDYYSSDDDDEQVQAERKYLREMNAKVVAGTAELRVANANLREKLEGTWALLTAGSEEQAELSARIRDLNERIDTQMEKAKALNEEFAALKEELLAGKRYVG